MSQHWCRRCKCIELIVRVGFHLNGPVSVGCFAVTINRLMIDTIVLYVM